MLNDQFGKLQNYFNSGGYAPGRARGLPTKPSAMPMPGRSTMDLPPDMNPFTNPDGWVNYPQPLSPEQQQQIMKKWPQLRGGIASLIGGATQGVSTPPKVDAGTQKRWREAAEAKAARPSEEDVLKQRLSSAKERIGNEKYNPAQQERASRRVARIEKRQKFLGNKGR